MGDILKERYTEYVIHTEKKIFGKDLGQPDRGKLRQDYGIRAGNRVIGKERERFEGGNGVIA